MLSKIDWKYKIVTLHNTMCKSHLNIVASKGSHLHVCVTGTQPNKSKHGELTLVYIVTYILATLPSAH